MRSNLATFVVVVVCLASFAYSRQFTIKDHRFYDPQGGEITFHGVNLVEKGFPFYRPSFGDEDLRKLKSWGMNGLRLGVMWPGVEPEEGKYNDTYLDYMLKLVNKAGEQYGIYSLIEFHQDLFSDLFCSAGVPTWAIQKSLKQMFPYPLFDSSKSTSMCDQAPWQRFYFTYSVNEAFSQLYLNENGLLEKFSSYWKKVAQTFKGNPFVIGYEIINQPWPGNMYKEPYVMIPGISELAHLQSFYDSVANEIRTVDEEQNICVEPVTWINGFPTGLQHSPGGNSYSNKSMLCFHYYSPPIVDMDIFLYARKLDMKRLEMGGILTEFFALTDQAERDMVILDKCDSMFLSWFAWDYRDSMIVWILKRTYAQRVAGFKQREYFNNVTKRYELRYRARAQAGQTRIFFNYDHYLYGEQNSTDSERNASSIKKINFTGPMPDDELNMQVKVFPDTVYRMVQNKYIIIDSKDIENRIVMVTIQRKINYPFIDSNQSIK